MPPAPPTGVLGTSAPSKLPWWQRGWGVATIGVVGLLVGIGIGGAVGTSTKTVTNRAATQTVTNTVSSVRTRTVPLVRTKTVTTTTPAPATAENGSGGGSGSGSGVQSFSGNGSKKLGTLNVAKDSTVEWTNDGDLFQTFDKEEGIGINSQAHSGTSDLPAGTYTEVKINAIGNWTFKIVPK